jgi:Tol biopolymer transport system component
MFLSACLLAALPGAGPQQRTSALAPTADGKLLFVSARSFGTDSTGSIYVWDLEKPGLKSVLSGTPNEVRTIQPTADGKRVVLVVGTTWTVYRIEVRDAATAKVLHKFDGSEGAGSTAAVSPDGKWVAYRARAEKAPLSVWNTETGKRAEELEKDAEGATVALAFSPDSKRLIVCARTRYAEYDVATGKKAVSWERADAKGFAFGDQRAFLAGLPDGKGVVMVSPTGKRRQSYIVQLRTEKGDQHLGELWDYAESPVVSPDGRWLIVVGGSPRGGASGFILKLAADGAAELEDKPEKPQGPFGTGPGNKGPAWRTLALGEVPAPVALAPDGKRLFVGQPGGRVAVFDPQARESTATLLAAKPEKASAPPEWHILTAAGNFVASPAESEALAKNGKVKDAAKVKEALGAK